MQNVIIYHNPRCSKSREALRILQDHHINPTIIEYLKNPLTEKELKQLLKKLDISPRELMRKNEEVYKSLKLQDPKLDDKDLIAAICANPILMERPIVLCKDKAIIARPPERLLELL